MTAHDSELCRAVASLNDVVAELACGLASGDTVSKGWAYTVVEVLGDHTLALDGIPRIGIDAVQSWEGQA